MPKYWIAILVLNKILIFNAWCSIQNHRQNLFKNSDKLYANFVRIPTWAIALSLKALKMQKMQFQ